MVYLLRSEENKGCNKSGIQWTIKKNTIYKDYRWNFVNKCEDPNISKICETKKVTQIYLITKNTIVFNSLFEISNKFGICPKTIKNAIKDKTVYNGYMCEFEEYPIPNKNSILHLTQFVFYQFNKIKNKTY